jgi:hypothetical protein
MQDYSKTAIKLKIAKYQKLQKYYKNERLF